MATAYQERWTRAEGVMVAPGLRPDDVRDHLAARGVVARLEWYPATPHLLSVAVAADESGRVAVTPPRRGGVVAGASLQELAHELGTTFGADVLMAGAEHTVADEDPAGGGPLAADSAQLVPDPEEWAEHDARTVVVTPLPAHTLPLHADLLGRPLAVLDAGDRRIVMTAGPGKDLGVYGWPEDAYPFLRLQADDEDRTALLGVGPDEVAVYSWEMHSVVVHGSAEQPGPALTTMAAAVLGDHDDAAAFAEAFGADVETVLAAMATPSAAGLAAFVAALGLPAAVTDVLEGRVEPAQVPGVEVHEPKGLTDAVSRSVGMRLTQAPGSGFWRAYVELLDAKPWLVRALSAAEATVGAALLGQVAARGRGRRTARHRVGATLGVGLVVDAAAGLAVSRLLRAARR